MRVTKSEAIAIGAIAVAAAFAVAQAWGRTLNPIVDVGRDLYVAERILQGDKLYRDVVYIFPPLTPYLLAGITFLTGLSLNAFAAIGLVTGALVATLLYLITRIVDGWMPAACATLLFVACNLAFTSPTMDSSYLAPYTYTAIFGLLFFLGEVASLIVRVYGGGSDRWMAVAVACALAAAFTKIEYAPFGAVMIVAVVIIHRLGWRWIAWYGGAFAVLLAIAALIFRDAGISPLNVIPRPMLSGPIAKHFYGRVTGMGDWRLRLEASLIGVVVVGVFALLVAMADRLRSRRALWIVAIIATAAYGIFIVASGSGFFRAWTIVQIVLIPFALASPREPLAMLLLPSLCTTSRIVLNVSPEWYGFTYVVPLYALFAYVVFVWLPQRRAYSRAAACLWAVPIVAYSWHALAEQRLLYEERRYPVVTRCGTFFDLNRDRAAILGEFLRDFHGRSLAVMPEGVSINYLAGVPTSLRYYSFVPLETAPPEVERDVIRNFETSPPEYVAIVTRSLEAYGFRGFGADYDRALASHIAKHYRVEKRWRQREFELILLRRAS